MFSQSYNLFYLLTADKCFSLFPVSYILLQTQIISDETWKVVDDIWDKRVQEIKEEAPQEVQEEEKPQLLMASHFL